MKTVQTLIVEDQPDELEALRRMIAHWPGFHCAGAFLRAEEALAAAPAIQPDAAIVDLHLPGMSGARCIWQLKELCPRCEVLVHTIETRETRVFEALQAGATGYLVKGASPREMQHAVRDVLNNGSPMTPSIARLVLRRFQRGPAARRRPSPLTARQTEVLELIARGYTNEEAGRELNLTGNTVKTHIRHIYDTLQVHSRAEVVTWWHGQTS